MGCFDFEELWGVHEECGVFGIYNPGGDCARDTYYGLYALQHRGQESCGIAANNNRDITCYKDMGMVGDVFSEEKLDELGGTMAVGHVRYSTAASDAELYQEQSGPGPQRKPGERTPAEAGI